MTLDWIFTSFGGLLIFEVFFSFFCGFFFGLLDETGDRLDRLMAFRHVE